MRRKRKTKVLTEAEKRAKKEAQAKRRQELAFKKKIKSIFIDSGFTYIPTLNKHFKIGLRDVELDYVFIYENVILICEDTCGVKKDKDHIRRKSEAFKEITSDRSKFISWVNETCPEKANLFSKYNVDRYHIFYLYIPQADINLTDDEKTLYGNIIFVDPSTLLYFHKISQCIYRSARYEIFRYLKLKDEDIGYTGSEGAKTTIKAPIIYPTDVTGVGNGIRVVSFMMSAEKLLKTCYVLRKDNWENSIYLYQRLIEKEKVRGIRNFLVKKGEAFYNNIIVALPDNVTFENDEKMPVSIDQIAGFQHCKLIVPDEMNSICVIDGQHRIFSHYEGPETDKNEEKIAQLRKQLHLLVTGLIFPKDMNDAERKKIQSEIFLDINDNTKKVAPNVLTHIEMIKDPFSDIGLARRVLEKMNGKRTFLNKFELSLTDETKIKVSSIIKFALRYLVSITPAEGKPSMFDYWDGDKEAFWRKEEAALNSYIDFVSSKLDEYFRAVKDTNREAWESSDSKLLSVTAINGFIIAYNRQLQKNGIQDFAFYSDKFKKMNVDFSKESFIYASSQYRKFSNVILQQAFEFTDEEIEKY